jgi:thioredoxin-like negative regulator of GroEL
MQPSFGRSRDGHHEGVETESVRRDQRELPVLLFVGKRRSGPSRRMESLVAWVKVNQKSRLRVVEVDGDRRADIVRRFGIREFPSLVLIDRRRVVARLEGRATGHEIERVLRAHLAA